MSLIRLSEMRLTHDDEMRSVKFKEEDKRCARSASGHTVRMTVPQ